MLCVCTILWNRAVLGQTGESSGFELLGLCPRFCKRVIVAALLIVPGCSLIGRRGTAHFSQIPDGVDSHWLRYGALSPFKGGSGCVLPVPEGSGPRKMGKCWIKKKLGYIFGPLDRKGLISIFTTLSSKQWLKSRAYKKAAWDASDGDEVTAAWRQVCSRVVKIEPGHRQPGC